MKVMIVLTGMLMALAVTACGIDAETLPEQSGTMDEPVSTPAPTSTATATATPVPTAVPTATATPDASNGFSYETVAEFLEALKTEDGLWLCMAIFAELSEDASLDESSSEEDFVNAIQEWEFSQEEAKAVLDICMTYAD